MERKTILGICYDGVVILNSLALLLWIFLVIFPGIHLISTGLIGEGFALIFLDFWFFVVLGTLGIGLLLWRYIKTQENQEIPE